MDLASYIDHTLLRQTASGSEVAQLCMEAKEAGFAVVCIPPYWVTQAKEHLTNANVKVATVIGFPFGYNSIASKLKDIEDAIKGGADELDVVINLIAVGEGDWQYIEREIGAVVETIHKGGKAAKIIIESGVLRENQIRRCCAIVESSKAEFIKTSTGYADTGATVAAVRLMRECLPASVAIKASGGIRTFAFAKELIEAGADRIGCSASMKILEESKQEQD
jgi:deoxyribose-phosphate aldolase